MSNQKEHTHTYTSTTRKFQTYQREYVGQNSYKFAILDNEEIIIFCIECGDSKPLTNKDTKDDTSTK